MAVADKPKAYWRRLSRRVERSPGWTALRGLGAVASIVGAIVVFLPPDANRPSNDVDPFRIERMSMATCGPLWGPESFSDDQLVASVRGEMEAVNVDPDSQVLAFWRLAQEYETNWHLEGIASAATTS